MAAAVDFALEHGGEIVRLPGGYWTHRGAGWNGNRPAGAYFGSSTIQACVLRGALEYSEWKENRMGSFPVAARIPQHG